MDGSRLRKLRDELKMTQQELAAALNQSFATVNRWETGRREIPPETSRLLECLAALLEQTRKPETMVAIGEIREAAKAVGISGIVSQAALAGLLPRSHVMLLATVPVFGWVGAALGVTASAVLPFFRKLGSKPRPDGDSRG